MPNIDIYKKICLLLEDNRRGVLATIIKTRGSTPAGALSKMVILEGGSSIIGTVGGGCVEAEVITESKKVYQSGKQQRNTYHMTEDDVEGGLICGGTVDILLEPLSKDLLPVYKELIDRCVKGEDSILGSRISIKNDPEKFLLTENGQIPSGLASASGEKTIGTLIEDIRKTGKTQIIAEEDSEIILEPVVGMYSVILFGGGHVSKFTADIARKAGFAVYIVDDRIKYASRKRFPNADKVICSDFRESFTKFPINKKTFIVIVTRGHAYDEVVLEEAVRTNAGYIGMIGSRRKISKTYDNLLERGIAIEDLEKVHAPLGLDIGAQTAEEIAVSIIAELIQFRNRGDSKPVFHFNESMRSYFKRKNSSIPLIKE